MDSTQPLTVAIMDSFQTLTVAIMDSTQTLTVAIMDSTQTLPVAIMDSFQTLTVAIMDSTQTLQGGNYARITAHNATHLTYDHVANNGGMITDTWMIVQDKHGAFPQMRAL
jgi:hypothetical protein